jgi:hypothetical protein
MHEIQLPATLEQIANMQRLLHQQHIQPVLGNPESFPAVHLRGW